MKYNLPNRKSEMGTPEEEAEFRQRMANSTAKVMKIIWRLLKPLVQELPDPRDQRYITYPKEALFLYGVMMFAMKATSRRNATHFMTEPFIQENLRNIIPGLESVAHNDTLANYLERIDPEVIQEIYHALIKKLLRNKEFKRLTGRITVLIDGSGKGSKDWKYSDKALHKKNQDGKIYMTYVLDAVLVLENGMVIPLITEFLENTGTEFDKQDCERKAWYRMAPKLYKLIGSGAMIIMDGLYAVGPVIMQCRKFNWDYLITLKDGSMPSFAEDAHGIMKIESSNMVSAEMDRRQQVITWANDVEYNISQNNTYVGLHVVRMVESWTEKHPITGKADELKVSIYQWISSIPITRENAQYICLFARKRWSIEINFKTEKNGYGFEHYFSLDWDVNKAYHYFMNFGHFINVLLMSSEELVDLIAPLGGISEFLAKVRLVFSGFVLDAYSIRSAVMKPFRWRFCTSTIYSRVSFSP